MLVAAREIKSQMPVVWEQELDMEPKNLCCDK